MAFLSKVFGGTRKGEREREVEVPSCPHKALVPRWDNNEDLGSRDKISSYYCTACGQTFSREEGESYLA